MRVFDRFFGLKRNSADIESDAVATIIESVGRLLNTRSSCPASQSLSTPRQTVLDYGLPDFIHLSPQSRTDAEFLSKIVANAIRWHEPRFVVDDVAIDVPRPRREIMRVRVFGRVVLAGAKERFASFSVEVGRNDSKSIKKHDS